MKLLKFERASRSHAQSGFGIVSYSFGNHFGIMWESFWDRFGIILASCWDRFGYILGTFGDPPLLTSIGSCFALVRSSPKSQRTLELLMAAC